MLRWCYFKFSVYISFTTDRSTMKEVQNNLLTTVQNVPSTRSKDTFLSHCVSLIHSYDAQSHMFWG